MAADGLITLFKEKLMLYHELVEVLKSERDYIISGKTDSLWQASSRKQQIASGIEAVRERILEALAAYGISHEMSQASFRSSEVIRIVPVKVRIDLLPIQHNITLLKTEIRQRSQENIAFVEEYLSTLDDLIGIFTRDTMAGKCYDRNRNVEKTGSRSLMHREV